MRTLPSLLACACLLVCPIARADEHLTAPELSRARAALERYDVLGDVTIATIRDLGRFAARATRASDRREAQFLRAVAATDLLVIAERTGDADLAPRVARAFGASPRALTDRIAAELRAVSVGAYADDALNALRALSVVRDGPAVDPAVLRDATGPRRDALFVGAARFALVASNGDVDALASFARDPCDGAACADPYARFDAAGRRGLAALEEAMRAAHRVEVAAQGGDPLSRLLLEPTARDARALAGFVLHPTPRIDQARALAVVGSGADVVPDLVLFVEESVVHYGFVPCVRVLASGEAELFASGRPMLPETAVIRLPRELRPDIRPIAELSTALSRVVTDPAETTVAVGAPSAVPSHRVARVLLSAREAGIGSAMLAGVASDRGLRFTPVDIVAGMQVAQAPDADLRVHVRLGGYSVADRRRAESIPRVRERDGFRFDDAALAAFVSTTPAARTASVRFMGDVAAGPLLSAAFHVGQATQVSVLIP